MKKLPLIALVFSLLLSACGTETTGKQGKNTNSSTLQASDESPSKAKNKKHILFFGNSLTAAFGLDPSEGFVGVIQNKLDAQKLPYRTVNAGLSGETTAGGNSRIDWILDQQAIDIFILELGGNDGLRGINPKDSYKNLQSIIDKVKAKNVNTRIVLAGMEAPPNMGPEFTSEFRNNYARLAETNNLALIPFLLDKVGGIPELNQKDGIHPTVEGHLIVAENIWKVLAPMLEDTSLN